MSKAIGTEIEQLRASIEEIRYTHTFYQDLTQASNTTKEELDLARLKMQYAKEFILKRSFALKRLLRSFENHLS